MNARKVWLSLIPMYIIGGLFLGTWLLSITLDDFIDDSTRQNYRIQQNDAYIEQVDSFRYNGHGYLVFKPPYNTQRQVVHDPDCKCNNK